MRPTKLDIVRLSTLFKHYYLFLFFYLGIFYPCFAQETQYFEAWTSTDGTADDTFNSIVSTMSSDNGMYIAASELNVNGYYDLLLRKISKTGSESWSTTFNLSAAGNAAAGAITLDQTGNVLVTGTAYNGNNNYDLFVVKYDPAGTLLWYKTYNGAASFYDAGKAIICDENNKVYVTGGSFENPSHADMLTICYSPTGIQQWTSHFDHNNLQEGGASIKLLNSNTLVVSGPTQTAPDHWEYAAVQYNVNNGLELFSTVTLAEGGTMDEFVALAIDADEHIYLTGSVKNTSTGFFDFKTYKLDPDLQIIWEQSYAGNAGKDDKAKAIAIDGNGNVYVTGFSTNAENNRDVLTIKYNSSGTEQWVKKSGGAADDEARDITIDATHQVFIAGYTRIMGQQDFYILSYDENGNERWTTRYNGLYNKNDVAQSIKLDEAGNVLVSGYSETNTKTQYLTVKYAKHTLIVPPDDGPLSKSFTYLENRGQLKDLNQQAIPQVRFYNTQRSPSIYFQKDRISYVVASIDTSSLVQDTLHRVDMSFGTSGRKSGNVYAMDRRADYFNYYLGHIPEGRAQVGHYERLVYPELYPGIDLIIASNSSGAKYSFICKANAEPDSILWNISGQNGLELINGDLHIATALEAIVLPQAIAYQLDNSGNIVELTWTPGYIIDNNQISFNPGNYDPNLPLVFEIRRPSNGQMCEADATGIEYSTYYGDVMYDFVRDMCPGQTTSDFTGTTIGDLFLIGNTASVDFPILGELITDLQGNSDIFVMAMQGLARLWVTHYGGDIRFDGTEGQSFGRSIVFDATNQLLYFTGHTNCINFPVTQANDNPLDDYIGSPPASIAAKGYLTRLTSDGFFDYGTYFGGTTDRSRGISLDIDNRGHIFLAGHALQSTDLEDNGGAFYQDTNNDSGGFIAEFDLEQRLIWSTRFGGGQTGGIHDIKIDQQGDLFVLGSVEENEVTAMDFVNQTGINDFYEDSPQGHEDAFIAKFRINDSERSLIWSTIFGGNASDFGGQLEINSIGEVYVTGYTESGPETFPLTGNFVDNISECGELFISRFTNDGVLNYSSFFGGSLNESVVHDVCPQGTLPDAPTTNRNPALALTIDGKDNVYITSQTKSTDLDLVPFNEMYFQNTLSNDEPPGITSDAFLLMLNKNMIVQWATYFGGKEGSESENTFHNGEGGEGILVIGNRLYLSGRSDSVCRNIPLKDNPEANYFQEEMLGGNGNFPWDAFITVFDIEPIISTSTEPVVYDAPEVLIYPSPADDYLIIDYSKAGQQASEIQLFDYQGRQLIRQALNQGDNTIEIPTTNLTNGMYWITIDFGQSVLSTKIVIQH